MVEGSTVVLSIYLLVCFAIFSLVLPHSSAIGFPSTEILCLTISREHSSSLWPYIEFQRQGTTLENSVFLKNLFLDPALISLHPCLHSISRGVCYYQFSKLLEMLWLNKFASQLSLLVSQNLASEISEDSCFIPICLTASKILLTSSILFLSIFADLFS